MLNVWRQTFVGKLFSVGNFINVDGLKQQYPHLEPIPLKRYSYANFEMILGQEMFHVIRTLECFETDRKGTPIAVRIPFGWVLSGPLPSTSGIFSTCFRAVTKIEVGFNLADQVRSWYDMKSFGAYKQVDPGSASDAVGQQIMEDTTYYDGCRYQVGLLWANDRSSLPQY